MSQNLGKCLAEYKTSASGIAKVVFVMLASFAAAAVLVGLSINAGPHDTGGRIVLFLLGLLVSLPGLLCIHGLTRGPG